MRVTVGTSGTGGGFEKFCAGETDISNASRPIEDEEIDDLQEERHRLRGAPGRQRRSRERRQHRERLRQVPDHRPAQEDLGQGFEGQQLERGRPELPGREAATSTDPAPTPARSTTSPKRSTAKKAQSRTDYNATEDDNVVVQGVSGSEGGLGYFGLSYVEQNTDKVKALEVDGGDGCVAPSTETVQDGTYTPLSRPLFIYAERRRPQAS